MKIFLTWLILQCVFARILIGMSLGAWMSLKISPDYLGYFIFPPTLIILAETIVSGIVAFPLATGRIRY